MARFKIRKYWITVGILMTAILSGCAAAGSIGSIRFGTAAEGGIYYVFSSEFSGILGESGVNTSARETAGSAANIRLLSQGYIDLGLAQSDLISEMYYGEAYGLDKNYRGYSGVAALYPEYVQIVVRKDSDIHSVDDLDGRSISVGMQESGTERDALQILSAYGLDSGNVTELNYNYADAMEHLLQGDIDLMFVTAGTPSAILAENADSIRLLSIEENKRERILSTFDGFEEAVIPAGTYAGQEDDIATICVNAVLLASDDISSDTVYQVTKTLFDHKENIEEVIGVPLMDEDEAGNTLSIPLHAGAAAWYADQGISIQEDGDGKEAADAGH